MQHSTLVERISHCRSARASDTSSMSHVVVRAHSTGVRWIILGLQLSGRVAQTADSNLFVGDVPSVTKYDFQGICILSGVPLSARDCLRGRLSAIDSAFYRSHSRWTVFRHETKPSSSNRKRPSN